MKKIPLHSMVLVIGSNKFNNQHFTKEYFHSYEVLNLETIRLNLTGDRFNYDLNHLVDDIYFKTIEYKILIGERVIVDDNFTDSTYRKKFLNIATKYGIPVYYIMVDGFSSDKHYSIYSDQDIRRGDGQAYFIDCDIDVEPVEKTPNRDLKEFLERKGFRGITVLGDVHGNLDGLKSAIDWASSRKCILLQLGDIVDYGPHSLECIDLIYDRMVRGLAIMVIGNHDKKIYKWLKYRETNIGREPTLSQSNKETVDKILSLSSMEYSRFLSKFNTIIHLSRNHYNIGDFIFTHASVDPKMFDLYGPRLSGKLELLSLYGETSMIHGNNIRSDDWVDNIPENKIAVVGHDIKSTLLPMVSSNEKVIFMDTGSSKGGRLTSGDIMFNNFKKIQNFNWH